MDRTKLPDQDGQNGEENTECRHVLLSTLVGGVTLKIHWPAAAAD